MIYSKLVKVIINILALVKEIFDIVIRKNNILNFISIDRNICFILRF